MILVTVGTQGPFDRLIAAADSAAAQLGLRPLFQIHSGSYIPKTGEWKRSLTVGEFNQAVMNSQMLIAHAGMGSIITALEYAKPVIVVPRLAHLSEHRNDHQSDTAAMLESLGMIQVCWDLCKLPLMVERASAGIDHSVKASSNSNSELAQYILECVARATSV